MTQSVTYLLAVLVLEAGALLVFRVLVRRDYAGIGRLSLFSGALELVVCLAYVAVPYLYNPPCWASVWACRPAVSPRLAALGYLLTAAGAVLAFGSMVWLGVIRSFGQRVGALYRTGPYGLTRNPQIVGGTIMVSGIALLWPSWYAVGWVALWIGMFHPMVLTEEEFLLKVYREDYQQYCELVPRYVGWRRSWGIARKGNARHNP